MTPAGHHTGWLQQEETHNNRETSPNERRSPTNPMKGERSITEQPPRKVVKRPRDADAVGPGREVAGVVNLIDGGAKRDRKPELGCASQQGASGKGLRVEARNRSSRQHDRVGCAGRRRRLKHNRCCRRRAERESSDQRRVGGTTIEEWQLMPR